MKPCSLTRAAARRKVLLNVPLVPRHVLDNYVQFVLYGGNMRDVREHARRVKWNPHRRYLPLRVGTTPNKCHCELCMTLQQVYPDEDIPL